MPPIPDIFQIERMRPDYGTDDGTFKGYEYYKAMRDDHKARRTEIGKADRRALSVVGHLLRNIEVLILAQRYPRCGILLASDEDDGSYLLIKSPEDLVFDDDLWCIGKLVAPSWANLSIPDHRHTAVDPTLLGQEIR